MAKEALKVFIHSLPHGSKFNVCSFGSTHEWLFKNQIVVDYNEQNMAEAIKEVNTYDGPDMGLGGTEIYKPLQDIFNR